MSEHWYDKYIELGPKKLTSGIASSKYYNFRKMSPSDMMRIAKRLENEAKNLMIIGIKTMGWKIAKLLDRKRVVKYDPEWEEIEYFVGKYVIFDDVITTFGTIAKCIKKIGRLPEKVICIVNRMNIVELK